MKQTVLILLLLISVNLGFAQNTVKHDLKTGNNITNVNVYPNPFNEKTNIFFDLDTSEEVTILVQNILGEIVLNKKFAAKQGKNSFTFYKGNLPQGMYIYTVSTKNNSYSKRLVIK